MTAVKLRRITTPADPVRGFAGSTFYQTQDGRFTIYKIHGIETTWQAKAVDGSKPFGTRYGGSEYFNADTLTEIREELIDIYESETEDT